MKYLLPSKIGKGNVISIVAPGSPVQDCAALERGIRAIEKRGYRADESRHLYDRELFHAGSDDLRAGELNRSFADPAISAIMNARGGAGSIRILPLLDYETITDNPKILVGYSDTTALQLAILKQSGLVSFYGPMVETDLGRQPPAMRTEQLWDLLTGEHANLELRGSDPDDVITLYPGEASGHLVGGCLSIFVSLLGTPYEPDTKDAILFFEDIDEFPHRVERNLTQLLLAGKLQAARGIIFGSFPRSTYPPDHEYHVFGVSTIDVVKDRVVGLKIPCIYGLPFGHVRDPYTIPLGGYGHLDATRKLVIVEKSVT